MARIKNKRSNIISDYNQQAEQEIKYVLESHRKLEDKYSVLREHHDANEKVLDLLLSPKQDSIYQNTKTGMGTPWDASQHNKLKQFSQFSFNEIENICACNPIIAKILETIVLYVFKNDFRIESKNKEYNKEFKKIWDDFGLPELTRDCYDAAMATGNAFLLPDTGEDFSNPLDIDRATELLSFSMLNRYFLAPSPTERNFQFSPAYYYLVNQPLYGYNLNDKGEMARLAKEVQRLQNEKIHYTNLIGIWGVKLKPFLFRTNMHFHDTYIRKIKQCAQDYEVAISNMATLLSKIPIAKMTIEGLKSLLSNKEQRVNFARDLGSRELTKSLNNPFILDSKETYELYTPVLSGMSDLIEKLERSLCLHSHIPHDVLFGEGSTGSTSGRTEQSNFECFIQSEQRQKIMPVIKFCMRLFQSVYGLKIPEDFEIKFDHTETPTEMEESQIFLNNANACNILAEQGFDCTQFITDKYPQITREVSYQDIMQPEWLEVETINA